VILAGTDQQVPPPPVEIFQTHVTDLACTEAQARQQQQDGTVP
jgi:hypothetical protein